MDQLDDKELVARYREGDVGALDVLVQRYRRPLFGYILNMIGNTGDADEIFQNAWMKVIRKIGLYRHGNFFGWLVRITHNVVIDSIRKRKPTVSLDAESEEGGSLGDVLPDDGPSPHDNSQNRDLGEMVKKAVATLPDEQKEVFLLRTKAELPFKEIAKIQGTSINTALARMQYALAKLRVPLRECYDDLG
ncbi:MAG: sigma-70 family RNA polymerase sigma factor [Verrucomicrobia bacterium]|jgi:RNA polymerase sigma-70 factor, ECF subfamily|nr:sigma-70 family RNA polymerase sigma factor [Verrucomicrobiota bacterium]